MARNATKQGAAGRFGKLRGYTNLALPTLKQRSGKNDVNLGLARDFLQIKSFHLDIEKRP